MASKDTGCSTMDNIYKQESDPRYRYKLKKSQVGVLSFFLPNDKSDKFTARKHTRPVGRPHGKFYSPATDDHSPMRAGEWNFTPLLIFISKWHKHDNISIGDICERCGNIFDMFDKMWFDCSTSYKMRCYCVTCGISWYNCATCAEKYFSYGSICDIWDHTMFDIM